MFRKKQEVLILPSGARALNDSVNDLKAPKARRSSKSEAKRYTRSKVGNFFLLLLYNRRRLHIGTASYILYMHLFKTAR